jgi:hypothetical protein
VVVGLELAQFGLDEGDDVLDGADVAGDLGVDAAAGDLVELDEHVDGVDAVEVEVLEEARLGPDVGGVELEGLDQDAGDPLVDFRARHEGAGMVARGGFGVQASGERTGEHELVEAAGCVRSTWASRRGRRGGRGPGRGWC